MSYLGRIIHSVFSKSVLLPLTRARTVARPALPPVMFSYYEGLKFRNQSAAWGTDRKREWILNRLRYCVRRAYRETTFYRKRFDSVGFDPRSDFSFDDFASLPVLEKEDL